MKSGVGREISFGESLAPVALPKERRRPTNVLDLREIKPRPVRPRPAQRPEPALRVHDRMAEDVARVQARPKPVPRAAPVSAAAARLWLLHRGGPTLTDTPTHPASASGGTRRQAAPPPAAQSQAIQVLKAVVVLLAALVCLSFNNVALPERLIGIYLVASFVYAFDSQRTFLVALIFLALVAVSSALGQSVPAQNYAIYAFYFLVIGLIAAIREQITGRTKTVGLNSQLSKR
jgi:hypothetical protein